MQKISHAILIISIFFLLSTYSFVLPMICQANTESLLTSITIIVSCGDGSIGGLEVCDPGEPPGIEADLNGLACLDFNDDYGNPFNSGDLYCQDDCSDYATSSCYTCGNGIKEESEECDSSDFGGRTCITLGFDSGSLSCTSECRLNISDCASNPTTGGGGAGTSGGASAFNTGYDPGSEIAIGETKVIAKGKSYANSDVHILVDGKVVGITRTDNKANFYFETDQIGAGIASFGFWSEDPDGLKSTLLSLTFRVISGAVTNISGIYIAPTIDIDKKSVKQGEVVNVFGQTVPDTSVNVHVHSENQLVEKIHSTDAGKWTLELDTQSLEEDFHIAKALFETEISGNIIQSGFSKSISFYVGKTGGDTPCPEADLNGDGSVNITDFSILLYYWDTDDVCADQNQNGVVDLIDFSIMMYYWTG